MHVDRISWKTLEKKLTGQRVVALLPVGSLEQHGFHLPLGTDTILVEYIAEIVEKTIPEKVAVFPTFPYGISAEHAGFPGTVTVGVENFSASIYEIIRSIFEARFHSTLILNGHGGNTDTLRVVTTKWNMAHETKVYLASVQLKEVFKSVFGLDLSIHAGYAETSMIEALDPSLVDTEGLDNTPATDFKNATEEVFSVMRAKEISVSGMVELGKPFASGDPEKGRAALQTLADKVIHLVNKIIKTS